MLYFEHKEGKVSISPCDSPYVFGTPSTYYLGASASVNTQYVSQINSSNPFIFNFGYGLVIVSCHGKGTSAIYLIGHMTTAEKIAGSDMEITFTKPSEYRLTLTVDDSRNYAAFMIGV